jgi:two-component system NarL family sensor kinase
MYVRYDVLEQRQHRVLTDFSGIGLLGLGLFAASQLWLAWTNLRWLRRERAHMSVRSAEAVEEQRRRVARELHDGVVQDLIGAAYLVNGGRAPLEAAGRADAAEALHHAETSIRTSVRSLRSLLIELYPTSLRSAGLGAALLDLVDPIQARGTDVHVDLPDLLDLPDHLEAALYRAAREGLRNAVHNGRATSIRLSIRLTADNVELVVKDDGVGFDPRQPAASGHLGLRAVADEAEVLGGVLEVTSALGHGTELRLALPRRSEGRRAYDDRKPTAQPRSRR